MQIGLPLSLALLWSSYKEPIVNIPKRVWHEWLCFVMTPLTIHNELVLVVAVCIEVSRFLAHATRPAACSTISKVINACLTQVGGAPQLQTLQALTRQRPWEQSPPIV